jgi:hypothetical protein
MIPAGSTRKAHKNTRAAEIARHPIDLSQLRQVAFQE